MFGEDENEYEDKNIVCIECKCDFIFTGGEQKFLTQLVEEGKMQTFVEPKRCPACRLEKKKRYEAQAEFKNKAKKF